MSIWKRITFWTKIQLTIQAVLSLAQLSLIFGESKHIYNVFITAGQLLALIIPIWIEDKDNDGNVDLFQKEITVKVKSESPVNVTTEINKSDE